MAHRGASGNPKSLGRPTPPTHDRWVGSAVRKGGAKSSRRWACGNVVSCGFTTGCWWEMERHRCKFANATRQSGEGR